MFRLFAYFLLMLGMGFGTAAEAQQNSFDLAGPELSVMVTRSGVQLPLSSVPSLKEGDRLVAKAAFGDDQSARYLMVLAFLRGATNPPPKSWFSRVETWNNKKNIIDVTVPAGAQQAVLFLAPDAGGGFDAVRDAVRGRPGIFVRAAADLQQASLDRARLEAFVSAIDRIAQAEPQRLAAAAPTLADALRIKLDKECLARPRSQQAACLTRNRDALVLQAQHRTTFTETLTGAPIDLAYGVAATREGGAGFYSPYISVARDVARLFGAFRTAQYQYLPALALAQGDRIRLQLNAAPSFDEPRSVLVMPLPEVGSAQTPNLKAAGAPVCLARPGAVMSLEDASLLFATGYGRDLTLQVEHGDGKSSVLPVVADVASGGIRIRPGTRLPVLGPIKAAQLRGRWGFEPFVGPVLSVQLGADADWAPQPDDIVVVGRTHPLFLKGGASSCVTQVALHSADGRPRLLQWESIGADELKISLPLGEIPPGPLTLVIGHHGSSTPMEVTLDGRSEASQLSRFIIHAGDRVGTLEGQRLDQVTRLELNGRGFTPRSLTREDGGDRLEMTSKDGIAEAAGTAASAIVHLRDGRSGTVRSEIARGRPTTILMERAISYQPAEGSLPIDVPDGLLPLGGTLTFSFRSPGEALSPGDVIEIAAEDSSVARLTMARGGFQRIGEDVGVASVTPHTLLGPAAVGTMRYRLVQDGTAGDWQPLARLARLPDVTDVDCNLVEGSCRLLGRNLFAIAALSGRSDFVQALVVPPGYVDQAITLPAATNSEIFMRLHDAPEAVLRLPVPQPTAGTN